MKDTPESIARDAALIAVEIGAARAQAAASGQPTARLDAAAIRAETVLMAAGEAAYGTAVRATRPTGEVLDPEMFGRSVRLRRARKQMHALRQRGQR